MGRDHPPQLHRPCSLWFQSTRPRGARRVPICAGFYASKVSIHAPAWGATDSLSCRILNINSFNPRARVGRDRTVAIVLQLGLRFQSTRPRGARHSIYNDRIGNVEFQSTRPRGARLAVGSPLKMVLKGFNPRARVGRDVCLPRKCIKPPGFQSTRPRGARPTELAKPVTAGCFNPRARVGRDAYHLNVWANAPEFQSTRPRGARRAPCLA